MADDKLGTTPKAVRFAMPLRVAPYHFLLFILFALGAFSSSWAAPPLSFPHAKYDNSESCDKCHEAFEGIPIESASIAISDIDRLQKQQKGYHFNAANNKPCKDCHREHMGRDYNMLGLEEESL